MTETLHTGFMNETTDRSQISPQNIEESNVGFGLDRIRMWEAFIADRKKYDRNTKIWAFLIIFIGSIVVLTIILTRF